MKAPRIQRFQRWAVVMVPDGVVSCAMLATRTETGQPMFGLGIFETRAEAEAFRASRGGGTMAAQYEIRPVRI